MRREDRRRRSYRNSRYYIPIPPNDLDNYFFEDKECGKYITTGYMNH